MSSDKAFLVILTYSPFQAGLLNGLFRVAKVPLWASESAYFGMQNAYSTALY